MSVYVNSPWWHLLSGLTMQCMACGKETLMHFGSARCFPPPKQFCQLSPVWHHWHWSYWQHTRGVVDEVDLLIVRFEHFNISARTLWWSEDKMIELIKPHIRESVPNRGGGGFRLWLICMMFTWGWTNPSVYYYSCLSIACIIHLHSEHQTVKVPLSYLLSPD